MILHTLSRLSCSFLIILLVNLFVHQPVIAEEDKSPSVADWINNQSPVVGEEEVEHFNQEDPDLIEQDSPELIEQENPFFLLLKLVFYLFIVIVLIYGLIKLLAIRQRKMQHNQLFQPLGGTTLGQNKSLQLVKIGGQIYLLGVADQITLIKEITNSVEISKIEKDLEERESIVSKSFLEFFQPKMKENDPHGSTHSFTSLFNQSLQHQKEKRDQLEVQIYSTKTDEKEGRSM